MKTLRTLPLITAFVLAATTQAQNIGINTTGAAPNASAMLDITATDRGLLIPRVALTATNSALPMTTPADALLVYNTATAGTAPNNVTPGFYYYSTATSTWISILSGVKGWSTTGNYGTVAGTNYLGTNDAQSLVIKTGGTAVANERFRVLATGELVMNSSAYFTGDVFSVYGTGMTSALSALGTSAINGYAGNNGVGVYGETYSASSSTGIGVIGNVAASSVPVNSASAGVLGINPASPSGPVATAGTAIGVEGDATGSPANGTTVGVAGFSTGTSGNAIGLYGSSPSTVGTGVMGIASSTSTAAGSSPIGVYASAASSRGFGVNAYNQHANGTGMITTGNGIAVSTFPAGGCGAAMNGNLIGGVGYGRTATSGVGLMGVGNNTVPLTAAQGAGVLGIGTQYGVMGFAKLNTNTAAGSNSATNAGNAAAGGYFEVQNGGTAQSWAYVGVRDAAPAGTLRKIIGNGTVNTIVKDLEGKLVALSCPEAPENLFQDYGVGKLVDGQVRIELDPVFAKNIIVNDEHPLRVFIQLEGDCNGVYVTNKTGTGFEVHELGGGQADVPFSFTVVANRADEILPDGSIARYSAERFPPAPGPMKTTTLETEETRTREPVNLTRASAHRSPKAPTRP